jgi:hypothetical protein
MSIMEGDDFQLPEPDFTDRSIGRRRDDYLQAMGYFDLKLKALEKECAQTQEHISELRKWVETDKERSSWFYSNRNHLETIVEGSKWASTTRKVVMLVVGTILGAIMFVQQIWPLFEGRIKP